MLLNSFTPQDLDRSGAIFYAGRISILLQRMLVEEEHGAVPKTVKGRACKALIGGSIPSRASIS